MRKNDIKRIVDWVLLEDGDGGGDGGGDWGWDGGYGGYGGGGYGGGGGSSLYTTFIQPFTDVLDTAASVVETGLSKIQLLTSIATYGVMSLLIPWVKPEYDKVIQLDKRRMNEIYRKHADVLKRTDQALTEVGGDYDGAGIFFVLFPDAVIAKNMVELSATGSETAVKIAADTALDFLDIVTFNATGAVTDPIRKHFKFIEAAWQRGDLITEAEGDDRGEADELGRVMKKVFSSPKIQKLLANSKEIRGMKLDGYNALKETVAELVEPIKKLKEVDSIQELERLTGGKLDLQSAMKDKEADPDELAIDEQELQSVVRDVLPGLIEQAAQPFIKRLESLKSGVSALAAQYDTSDDPIYKQVMKLFDAAEKTLMDE